MSTSPLHLDIPSPSLTPTPTAVFQHSPNSSSLHKEWEPGCQPDSVYDNVLPYWRARLRRFLVQRLHREKLWMADWQKKVRTPARDRYFYWTAIFGKPVDDCPCFEDAIAILSVILGSFLGHWHSPLLASASTSSRGSLTTAYMSVVKVVLGIGIIFVWRMIAKATLLRVLPPIFRFASQLTPLALPTRKFYKAATDYSKAPNPGFHPVPSFISLHQSTVEADSPVSSPSVSSPSLQVHSLNGGVSPRRVRSKSGKRKKDRPRYDADVLTKVGVYAGIGVLATTSIPIFFGALERYLNGS
ncbi:hypothetical protein P7C73_g2591, partial [Tremellales sp. Uapishka_1]